MDGEANRREKSKEFELGILFVHGIGEQRPGETLRKHADPLISWVRKLLQQKSVQHRNREREEEDHVRVDEGSFSTDENTVHLDLTVSPSLAINGKEGEPDTVSEQRWRLAECCWADCFPEPTAAEVASWTIPVLPAALVAHFARPLAASGHERKENQGAWRTIAFLWHCLSAFLFIVPVAVLLTTAMLILLLASIVPLKKLTETVKAFQQKLASVLGDSYAFIQSPSRRGVILDRFRTTLTQLADDCDEVVIVAHSQGAAVSFEGLAPSRQPTPDELKLLVTYGSGINKLWELRHFQHSLFLRALRYLMLGGLVSLLVFLALCEDATAIAITVAVHHAILSAAFLIPVLQWKQRTRPELRKLARQRNATLPKWYNFYASADPVSRGPLPNEFCKAKSIKVWNRGSVLRDHTSYCENEHEFVSGLCDVIAGHTGCSMPSTSPLSEKSEKSRRRPFVRCLQTTRWAIMAMTLLCILRLPEWTEPISETLRTFFEDIPVLNLLTSERILVGVWVGFAGWIAYLLYIRFWQTLIKADLHACLRDRTAALRQVKFLRAVSTLLLVSTAICVPFALEIQQNLPPQLKSQLLLSAGAALLLMLGLHLRLARSIAQSDPEMRKEGIRR